MKKIKSIVLALCLLSTSISCAQWGKWKKVKGDGNITTVNKNTNDYEALRFAGPMDFKLVPGTEGEITIKGDSNLMEYIITEVKNNKLIVKVKEGYNLRPTSKILITVPYKDINSVSLAGSGDIVNSGVIEADDFDVSLSGSGDIQLEVAANSVESKITGSGDIKLNGKTNTLKTKITGSGDFDGYDLKSNDVDAAITGSGNANVVCNGQLKGRVTGSGNISYKGNPQSKDTKTTGSGKIRG